MNAGKKISYSVAAAALKDNEDIIKEWAQSSNPLLKLLASEVLAVAGDAGNEK